MGAKVNLTRQQQSAVDSRGGALLVSAAAGSGKTKVLVERLLKQVVDEGRDIDSFLIITYTNAAASELRGKIIDAMREKITENPGDIRLHRQLQRCYKTKISTIHSFCTDVIRQNAHILDISPDVRIIDDSESGALREKVLSDLLDEKYESITEGDIFSRLTDTVSRGRSDAALTELVLDVYEKMQMSVRPDLWAEEQKKMLHAEGISDAAETIWGKEILSRAEMTAKYWYDKLRELINSMDETIYNKYGVSMEQTCEDIGAFLSALTEGWDTIREKANVAFPRVGAVKGYEDVKAARKSCKADMEKLMKAFETPSDALLSDMRSVAPVMAELIDTAAEFSSRYSAEKKKRGVIDFGDQEHLALRVLINDDGTPTAEASAIAQGFTEIMVDEYQDVNAVQEAIFGAVSKNGTNVFMVGDVKQSIYRFRLADPNIFIDKYKSMKREEDAAEGEGRKIVLSMNFRSRAGVLAAVNHVFRNIMSEELGEIDYTPDEYLYNGLPYPDNGEAETEICIVDLKNAFGDDDTEKPEKIEIEADAVSEKILSLKNTVKLSDGSGGLRDAEWGDFAILLRSMKDKAEIFAESLMRHGIPVSLDKGEDFFKSTEILTMLSLLTVIDNMRQDIPLISVMRSFLFGFTADELAGIRALDRHGDFYDAVAASAEKSEKVRAFLDTINSFREKATDMTADRLLWEIYMKTGALAVAGAMQGGETRQNNLTALFELARKYEADGYRGLFGFVTYLRESAQSGKITVNTGGNTDENAVQIVSIHKSKGLEYPIVIVADTAKRFNRSDAQVKLPIHPKLGLGPEITDLRRKIRYPSLAKTAIAGKIVSETLSEEMRVLYVALTRAREKLVVFASFADAEKRLKSLSTDLSAPILPKVLSGASSMADWILMAAMLRRECAEILGCGVPVAEDDGYVWKTEIIRPTLSDSETERTDEPGDTESENPPDFTALAEKLTFVYPYGAAENIPSKLTATELKGRFMDTEAMEEAESSIPRAETLLKRPDFDKKGKPLTGAERGTALHLVMQLAEYRKCTTLYGVRAEIDRLRAGRMISPEQADAVDAWKIYRFFTSDVGRRILRADAMRREFKFSVLVDGDRLYPNAAGEKILLQGVIDCFWEDRDGVHIVDYKTDFVTPENIEEKCAYYRGQLETYALALYEVTGKEVTDKGLYFFGADEYIPL